MYSFILRSLFHQEHFTIALVEILIGIVTLRLVFIERFSIQVSNDMIQVNTISKPLIIHIRTVPFEFGNISTDMQWTQFILGNFPDYFSRDCQNLDLDILRYI